MGKKIFVLDTNVILHDYNCIYNFEENDIVIPITVLEELDKFKKGNDQINFNARFFIRELDKLSAGQDLFNNGVSLGDKRGKLTISIESDIPKDFGKIFSVDKADNRILAVAYKLAKSSKRKVILISKDINLRMKARAIGVLSEDYESDKVANIELLFQGKEVIEDTPIEFINKFYKEPYYVNIEEYFDKNKKFINNQYLILKNGQHSALVYYNPFKNRLELVNIKEIMGIKPRNAEQTFALHLLLNPDVKLISLFGKAGTGKTLLALTAALSLEKFYEKIYLARPIVPLGNRDIGFLPGDIKSKIGPYMQPLYDNLAVIKAAYKGKNIDLNNVEKEGKLEISPLAYIRGRSLNNIFFIIDEAQNLTPHEIKTIVTRAGNGTKIVLTGDPFQIDTPYLDAQSNGLTYLTSKMIGQKIFGSIRLLKGERSELAELASNIL